MRTIPGRNGYFELISTPECSLSEFDQSESEVMTYCLTEHTTQCIEIPTLVLG